MFRIQLFVFFLYVWPFSARSEDGSRLWLRYDPVSDVVAQRRTVQVNQKHETALLAQHELNTYWRGTSIQLNVDQKEAKLKEGYRISFSAGAIRVTAARPVGLLYAAYHLLRLQETVGEIDPLPIEEIPSYDIRILNHWDNLDGSIERGYAGRSLWKWTELPDKISPRYTEYARANASIGINATVLNNVNASPYILNTAYLEKVRALADIFRPYGIRVYLSVNFSSPVILDGLKDADPSRLEVQDWWKKKVKEVYKLVPDFGGFLVKANSEGQPGPQDYGRTHAEGANMLADALKPFGGIVMWRAFVYSPTSEDRAKQAYLEFVPLDKAFRDNVIVQIKNGPIDFQPREPFNPLFGAMQHTSQMVEFQITQEYLGFSNHLAYLAPLFKETLDSDTYGRGAGSTVAKVTDGTWHPKRVSAIAAVANIGEDRNWTGHDFAQANWYAFGRLAWRHELSSEQIAEEWIKLTFHTDETFIRSTKEIMMPSREAVVNYMMPLGLHHIFAFDHHYGPEPWGDRKGGRADWMPWYYHNADSIGIGFNRTDTGSDAAGQYHAPIAEIYGDRTLCPENLLLWFHHVPWDYRMRSGRTLWEELCEHYDRGVKQTRRFQESWDRLEHHVDQPRFLAVQSKLKIQAKDAMWWKDACLLYFQTFCKKPIPFHIERPIHALDDLKKIKLQLTHHN
ncbi:alpha-glucuronidase [Sphingobacterium griseoflavum]|uniref:Xylan alpha-1,2-glucuronidase n=1 Tax=Sphingobacterium griseoflavum TaxID=1474952 RepID=A0ABQ3HXX6_9SPHI|nr:alpha-glucuronidase [Sphingobacterium griseoflavum]GHE35211.1 xylan alpha-1,2-glucuronidase [Sphingobacterium griseoflavum]